jgi:hypothetical protein
VLRYAEVLDATICDAALRFADPMTGLDVGNLAVRAHG